MKDTPKSRLNITFLKKKPNSGILYPYRPADKTFTVLGIYDSAVCSIVDLSGARTPDLMNWHEKQFGREITTRTWRTVGRIFTYLNHTIKAEKRGSRKPNLFL